MQKQGFSLVELLLVVAVMAAVSAVSIPMYQSYRIRSDLFLSRDVVIQALYRARLLTQTGQQDDEWRYSITGNTVYKGSNFVTRDTQYDEVFALPPSVTATGISEVSFSRVTGVPSPTGDIVLEALNGEKIWISITPDTAIAGDKPPPPQFKVLFEVLDNPKNGPYARNVIFVGSGSTEYPEGQWIPLSEDGVEIIDTGVVQYDEPGLYAKRQDGYLEVVHYGGSQPGKKVIIDANIVVENTTITTVENKVSPYDTENPFDGSVNNGVSGDEITVDLDGKSALFQTRETNGWDGAVLHW